MNKNNPSSRWHKAPSVSRETLLSAAIKLASTSKFRSSSPIFCLVHREMNIALWRKWGWNGSGSRSFCAAVFCSAEGRARNERRNGRLSLCYNSCSSKSILAQFEMLHKTGVTLHICFGRPITFFWREIFVSSNYSKGASPILITNLIIWV